MKAAELGMYIPSTCSGTPAYWNGVETLTPTPRMLMNLLAVPVSTMFRDGVWLCRS